MKKFGVQSIGLIAPIIREGDNLAEIVTETVLNSGIKIEDNDVIGITESIVARAEGNYVTIDEVAEDIKKKLNNPERVYLLYPIYSRNRFAMILKAFARAVKLSITIKMPNVDEVGNELKNHPFTGLNYDEYYRSIVEAEGKECEVIVGDLFEITKLRDFLCNYDKNSDEYAFDVRCRSNNTMLIMIIIRIHLKIYLYLQ